MEFLHTLPQQMKKILSILKQVAMFKELVNALPTKPRLVHAANTATALIKDSSLQFDAVRYGISLYGLAPSGYVANILPFPIQQAFSLETEIVHVKELQAGQSVGYGATFTATENCLYWYITNWLCRRYDSQVKWSNSTCKWRSVVQLSEEFAWINV